MVFRHRLPFFKRAARAATLSTGLLLLAACQQGGLGGLSPNGQVKPQTQAKLPILSPQVKGEAVGSGPVRVALLVPKSAPGGGGIVGKQLAQAAKMAMSDFGGGKLQLVIKDTKGQAATAQILTSEAIREGASMVLGPLFSGNVSSASAITEPAKRPMVAFSSDQKRARPGIYLLSFPPQDDIARTISQGISLGANRIIAVLPQSAYGNLAEQQLRQTANANGATVVAVTRYGKGENDAITAARSIALNTGTANGIYLPEGGNMPILILKTLKKSGAVINQLQVMGSGQWESVNVKDKVLERAIFAGADKRNFVPFANRFQSLYGVVPNINAGLAYDAVAMAAKLVRDNPRNPFTRRAIESPAGFSGVTGVFKFRSNGRISRSLVVNQIRNGRVELLSAASRNF